MNTQEHLIENLRIPFLETSLMRGGSLNYVFKGTHKGEPSILKKFNENFNYIPVVDRFYSELNAMKNPELPSPRLLSYSEKDLWIISEFLDGEPLKQREKQGRPVDVGSLVRGLKRIHSLERSNDEQIYRSYLKGLISKLRIGLEDSGLDSDTHKSVQNAIEYMESERKKIPNHGICRIHGDLNGENIILNQDGRFKSLIDWELSVIGSQYQGLAQLTNKYDDLSEEILDRYFYAEMDHDVLDFFLIYYLTKLVINNSPTNLGKMAFPDEEKIKIVQSKSKRLRERF